MPYNLSLHHLCAMEIDAENLVTMAARAGFQHVCLFAEKPKGMDLDVPVVTKNRSKSLRAWMDASSITALNVDAFVLAGDTNVADFENGMAVAAELGAKSCTVVVTDPSEARAIEKFGALCDLAAGYEICPGLEFMQFTPVDNLDKALRIVTQAAHPNGKLTLDLLHVMRNGAAIDAIGSLPDHLIGYVQLCDGPATPPADTWDEAVRNRMIPGEGEFPIAAFLAAVPSTLPIALEVPLDRLRLGGIHADERVRRLADAARRAVDGLPA